MRSIHTISHFQARLITTNPPRVFQPAPHFSPFKKNVENFSIVHSPGNLFRILEPCVLHGPACRCDSSHSCSHPQRPDEWTLTCRIVRAHVFLYSSLYQIWHRGCFHRAHHRILTPLVITRKRLGGWSTACIDRPPPIIALLNSTLRGRAASKEHPPRCFHTPPSLPSRHVISLLLQTAVDEARIRLIGLRRPGDRIKESG